MSMDDTTGADTISPSSASRRTADFAGLPEWIHRIPQILFGEFVDVVVRAIFGDFHDAAADFQVAVGIRGILQRNGNAWIAADIFVLHAALR